MAALLLAVMPSYSQPYPFTRLSSVFPRRLVNSRRVEGDIYTPRPRRSRSSRGMFRRMVSCGVRKKSGRSYLLRQEVLYPRIASGKRRDNHIRFWTDFFAFFPGSWVTRGPECQVGVLRAPPAPPRDWTLREARHSSRPRPRPAQVMSRAEAVRKKSHTPRCSFWQLRTADPEGNAEGSNPRCDCAGFAEDPFNMRQPDVKYPVFGYFPRPPGG